MYNVHCVLFMQVLSRIGDFLGLFHVQSEASTQHSNKRSVRFSQTSHEEVAEEKVKMLAKDKTGHAHNHSKYIHFTSQYVQPVITSVCALCLSQIYQSNSFSHLLLLRTMLRCYSSRTFFSLLSHHLKQGNASLASVLHHTSANIQESGEKEEEEEEEEEEEKDGMCTECTALVSLLISLSDPTSLDEGVAQKTDALFDCVLSLLHCGVVPRPSVINILTRLVQVQHYPYCIHV